MTNMQHYMDDIQDLLEGLDEEMEKRAARMAKWEDLIVEKTEIMKRYEAIVFDESKSMDVRTEAAHELAEMRLQIRDLAEKKTNLAEKNHQTVEKVCSKLNELAYHCKCEVEIDNPGCTEHRERAYYRSLNPDFYEQVAPTSRSLFQLSSNNPHNTRRRREYSTMTEEDKASTRSGTPFKEVIPPKKRPGRPRNTVKHAHFEKFPDNSNASSARSSMEPENPHSRVMIREGGHKKKKLSKYMMKKQEKLRLEEEERVRNSLFEVKKEVDTGDYERFAFSQWTLEDELGINGRVAQSSTSGVDLNEEEEQELMQCLNFAGLPSPPRGMMEELDVSESALYSMDMYPPDHKSENNTPSEFRHPGNYGRGGGASSSQSFIQQRSNNATAGLAAASSISDSSIDKRSTQRNTLFGSIPETSFSGRHRKLTDRVTEMIISQREKCNLKKSYREQDEWCFCNGANTDSEMMVECENKNCRGQWFHFDCVGLTESPQNEWYCPECSQLPDHLLSSSRRHD